MQMSSKEAFLNPSQALSQMFEVDDALQQHLIPWMALRNIMQIAGTCRAWRQLISNTPLKLLSEEAHRAVLPLGITSSLTLLELVKQQAQLVARLRGKHGFVPDIQRLSLRDDLMMYGRQQGDAQQIAPVRVPAPWFREILWSPCISLEDASRWLVLGPGPACKHLPIVMDMVTGQQRQFQEGPSPLRVVPRRYAELQAAWLTDSSGQILYFLSSGETTGTIACLVDAHSQSLLPMVLPGEHFSGTTEFFRVCSKEGSALDILCWFPAPDRLIDRPLEYEISVFHASSRHLLYQLSCPEQLQNCFQKFHHEVSSHAQQVIPGQFRGHGFLSGRVQLAPDKQLLAIVWRYFTILSSKYVGNTTQLGLSIHSAITGELLHSMLLMTGTSAEAWDYQLSWLPCSSNLMYVNDGRRLQLNTSSGCMLWTNAWADRIPPPLIDPAKFYLSTTLSPSPCGRWILVMDADSATKPDGHITIVEASTGRNLGGHHVCRLPGHPKGRWSMCGKICLFEQVHCMLVCCPQAHPAPTTFQQYKLRDRSTSIPILDLERPRPSPCDDTVISIDRLCDTCVQHGQVPPTSAIVKEAAFASQNLQSISSAGFSAGCRTRRILQEAWHSLHSACLYATSTVEDGVHSVHLINAQAKRCIWSWTEGKLHGPAMTSQPDDCDVAYLEHAPHVLSWSKDGRRLAVASGAYWKRGPRCCVLNFSDSST